MASRRIGRLLFESPLAWGGAYLFVWVAFALAYALLADHGSNFFAPYAHLDRDGWAKTQDFERFLSADLSRRTDGHGGVIAKYIKYEENSIRFTIQSKASQIEVNLQIPWTKWSERTKDCLPIVPYYTSEGFKNDQMSIINGIFGRYKNQEGPCMHVDEREFDRIFNTNREQNGLIVGTKKSLIEMFYFSAMTITTVGYGDIVPVSRIARVLCGLEAILGVVIVGFFVNSAAAGRQPAKQ
jgi:hypothetical protein